MNFTRFGAAACVAALSTGTSIAAPASAVTEKKSGSTYVHCDS